MCQPRFIYRKLLMDVGVEGDKALAGVGRGTGGDVEFSVRRGVATAEVRRVVVRITGAGGGIGGGFEVSGVVVVVIVVVDSTGSCLIACEGFDFQLLQW